MKDEYSGKWKVIEVIGKIRRIRDRGISHDDAAKLAKRLYLRSNCEGEFYVAPMRSRKRS